MPGVIACSSCAAKLEVPDGFTATKVKCPKCSTLLFLKPAKSVAASVVKPKAKLAKAPPAAANVGFERVEDDDLAFERVDDDVDDDVEVVKPKKKRRKHQDEKATSGMPAWAPWAAGGSFMVIVVAILFVMIKSDDFEIHFKGVILAISIPASTILLIVSMFIASAIGGGISFGAIHTAIFKALFLTTIVNFLSVLLSPIGGYLAIPIWYCALTFLFNLDFFEVGILTFVNWMLNKGLEIFLIGLFLTAANRAINKANDKDDFRGLDPESRRPTPSLMLCQAERVPCTITL